MAEYDSFSDMLKGRAVEGRRARSPPPVLQRSTASRNRSRSQSPSIRTSLDRQLLMGLNTLGGD
jgi:hypothetical protein